MIDSHHHLWRYSPAEYPWIPQDSPLAADQLIPELEAATAAAGVSGTVAVQARQTLEESDFLLSLADASPLIQGVVGWVPLIDPAVSSHLTRLAAHPTFKGVRHVLQDEADDYFLRDDFHRGLAQLPALDLSYDLLIFQRQIPQAIKLVDRQPELPIIIDHLAKPAARNGGVDPEWRSGMRELAKRPNIIGVKFSGLITEFPKGEGNVETISAYFTELLDIFGSHRVMFGTDWPVCLLRTAYSTWSALVKSMADQLLPAEREAILTENARTCYRLKT